MILRLLLLSFCTCFFFSCLSTPDDLIDASLIKVGDDSALSMSGLKVYEEKAAFERVRKEKEEELINDDVHYFSRLHEWSLKYRDQIFDLAKQVEQEKGPLKADLIHRLVLSNNDFVHLRYALYSLLKKNRNYYQKPPSGWEGSQHSFKGLCLSLAIVVTLYDNMSLSMNLLDQHERVQHLFLEGSVDYDISPEYNREVVKSFYSSRRRLLIREKMQLFSESYELLKDDSKEDNYLDYLAVMILQSPSAAIIEQSDFSNDLSQSVSMRLDHYQNSLFSSHKKLLFDISKDFGNTMGKFQSRVGYLYEDEKVLADVQAVLKPMDILLEKTPFRLTDKFIPGHFGHVAIYIGTEEDLKSVGLWEHPRIVKYHEQIRQGKVVLEALREGVVLNTLEHFMNVDDLAVIRKNDMDAVQGRTYTLNAFRQLGKEYDFNFDVETLNKIVCSELVYQVFTDDDWATGEVLGSVTISPDAVVQKLEDNMNYRLVLFYHKGEKVQPEKDTKLVLNLLSHDEK
ncbi:hypothetical protein LNTAR_08136 [Lentisphaera araneosa HTCC2155]|uniref:Poxvirus G6 n=1 Tax=Lentisphaera araneosa HTCC2155 TaxID=313628 RepID=A6DS01_9BACT|nr:YiiX/YebB-like N1pC/P60 family cysteine hydrolase [Lentisphaera araneosa]EDM25576.1 hypothetical protein LNTAR_08136 [Lentisphaera araneosa HTCC2155]